MSDSNRDSLSKQQNRIVAFIIENFQVETPIEHKSVGLTGGSVETFTFGYTKIADLDEEIFMVFTMSDLGDKIFVSFTDVDPIEVSKFLLTAEEFDHQDTAVDFGHTIYMLPSAFLEKHNKVGIVFLPISVITPLKDFEDRHRIGDKDLTFLLCVFISQEDHDTKRKVGFVGLLDKFQRDNKDLISITD